MKERNSRPVKSLGKICAHEFPYSAIPSQPRPSGRHHLHEDVNGLLLRQRGPNLSRRGQIGQICRVNGEKNDADEIRLDRQQDRYLLASKTILQQFRLSDHQSPPNQFNNPSLNQTQSTPLCASCDVFSL